MKSVNLNTFLKSIDINEDTVLQNRKSIEQSPSYSHLQTSRMTLQKSDMNEETVVPVVELNLLMTMQTFSVI